MLQDIYEHKICRRTLGLSTALACLALAACGGNNPQPSVKAVAREIRELAEYNPGDAKISSEAGVACYTFRNRRLRLYACIGSVYVTIVEGQYKGVTERVNASPEHLWRRYDAVEYPAASSMPQPVEVALGAIQADIDIAKTMARETR